MSLETVVEDIREKARTEAQSIRSEAEAEAETIVAEAETEAEEIRSEAEQRAEQRIQQAREQKLSSAKLEAKQERLEAQRDVLDEVYEAVTDEIASLKGDERRELTETLLDVSASEFDEGSPVSVFGRDTDAELLQDLVEDRVGFEHAGSVECIGGVVLESDASRVRVDNTFDSILDVVWEENLREISSQLFDQ